MGSNSEVGTFDRYVTHGLVTDGCATGGAVRCVRLRLQSDPGVCKLAVKVLLKVDCHFIFICIFSCCLVNTLEMRQALPQFRYADDLMERVHLDSRDFFSA